jgi:hypothetical protein
MQQFRFVQGSDRSTYDWWDMVSLSSLRLPDSTSTFGDFEDHVYSLIAGKAKKKTRRRPSIFYPSTLYLFFICALLACQLAAQIITIYVKHPINLDKTIAKPPFSEKGGMLRL